MEFSKLHLTHFRNITDEQVEFSPHTNVLVGENGQGKTNILEAIYLLSTGQSFRTSKMSHMIQSGQTWTTLKALTKFQGLTDQVEIRVSEKQRVALLNEKRSTRAELALKFPVVLFSPESLQIIKEGPDNRRQLVDELVVLVDPTRAQIVFDYQKVLKTKNRLLRDLSEERISRSEALQVLESLQPAFIERATELTMARLFCLRAIENTFAETFKRIINRPHVDILVDYVISGASAMRWSSEQVRDSLVERTLQIGVNELETGTSLVGPHKHEISFLYDGNDSRFFCSQGQQRAIILSFKIAQVMLYRLEHEASPVLLLDDVLSELDSERRDFLIHFLRESQAQTIVTTTDLAFCRDLRSEKLAEFSVHQGRVSRLPK